MKYFKDRNILLISPEPWGSNFVSKHHYAVILTQQGNSVYFLNPPLLSYSIESTKYDGLYVINYPLFQRGLRYLTNTLQRVFIRRKYEKIQQLAQCTFDTVWSFDNSVFYDFKALPDSVLKICHIVDLNQDFQVDKAARTADMCFCTTDLIQDRLLPYNSMTFKIHHGYNSHIRQTSKENIAVDDKYAINAAYVGNISMPYIDWEIIGKTVANNSDVGFYFIGPEGKSNLSKKRNHTKRIAFIKQMKNAFFLGEVTPETIPSALEKLDIMLVAYQEKYHTDQASPHKIMDYIGSGKVTVATYTDEYKDKPGLIVMTEKNKDFPQKFAEVLLNLGYYNSSNLIRKRVHFAKENTYRKHLQRIEHIITEYEFKP